MGQDRQPLLIPDPLLTGLTRKAQQGSSHGRDRAPEHLRGSAPHAQRRPSIPLVIRGSQHCLSLYPEARLLIPAALSNLPGANIPQRPASLSMPKLRPSVLRQLGNQGSFAPPNLRLGSEGRKESKLIEALQGNSIAGRLVIGASENLLATPASHAYLPEPDCWSMHILAAVQVPPHLSCQKPQVVLQGSARR